MLVNKENGRENHKPLVVVSSDRTLLEATINNQIGTRK